MEKIVVPNGMYQAAMVFQDSSTQCFAALRAALGWLSENPIVIDTKLANELWVAALNTSKISETGHAGKDFALALQRRMFLVPPENPVVGRVKSHLAGVTLSKEDADAIIRSVHMATRKPTAHQ